MKIMIPLLRRVMPTLMAADIVGVQPMTNIFDTRRRMISSEVTELWGDISYCVEDIGNVWNSAKEARVRELVEYCLETYGMPQIGTQLTAGACWKCINNQTFKFFREEDRMMFILRWNNVE